MVSHKVTHRSYNDILQMLVFKIYCSHQDLDDNFYHTKHSIDKRKSKLNKLFNEVLQLLFLMKTLT